MQLCSIGRPARFGKGEQTLLDARVRDTWEIPKSRIKIDKRQWNATLRPISRAARPTSACRTGCELTAEFHSMLVYARGQFFAPHQDSEKTDAMIGTLVVTLPSTARGGRWWSSTAGRPSVSGVKDRCHWSRSTPTAATRSGRSRRATASC